MIARFDIFKSEAHGAPLWIEAVADLDSAKARVRAIGAAAPGKYFILDQTTGNQIAITIAASNIIRPTQGSDADIHPALDKILKQAIEVAKADFGNIQLVDASDGMLRIAAHRGFSDKFLRFFASVYVGEACACGTVLKERKRVFVSDVLRAPIFERDTRNTLLADEVRAVQSMPLSTTNHKLIGVLSVHYRNPQNSIEWQSAVTDSFLTKAAELIQSRLEI